MLTLTTLPTRRRFLTGTSGTLMSTGLTVAVAGPAPATIGRRANTAPAVPLANAHAHNDYLHTRPLLDALSYGFTSVEADVWLVDGELRLGHTREQTRAGFTLTSAYLQPLARIAASSPNILPGWDRPFQLLIDIKSSGASTYAAVEAELARFPALLTEYRNGKVTPRSVTAVLSGERPLDTIAARTQRFSFVDGQAGEQGRYAPALMPLVSANWSSMFSWLGVLAMPPRERARLEQFTANCHKGGHRVRFYGTPDLNLPSRRRLWSQERNSGVDLLNTDDLRGLATFLQSQNA